MQRSFSAFPDGLPGAGLLILRSVAAFSGIGHAIPRLTDPFLGPLDALSATVAIASSLAVLVGGWTRGSAAVLAVGAASLWFPRDSDGLVPTVAAALPTIAITIAIALLGPGAFSIDARRFGPREIVISRDVRPRKP